MFTESVLEQVAKQVSRGVKFLPKSNSLDRDDLFQEAYLHGKKLWAKGQPDEPARSKVESHPDGAARGFHVWLYGRLMSHLRNLLAEEKNREEPLEQTGQGYRFGEMTETGSSRTINSEYLPDRTGSSQTPDQPPDDIVDALCAKLPPEASSVVRRLLAGEKLDDIAEALGISVRNVKRWVRTAQEVQNGD